MPTASGAAGRVTVGVDTSTRSTDGLKRKTNSPNRVPNSYLERYQELKKRKKNQTDLLQGKQDNTNPTNCENDGTKEASTQKQDSRGNQSSEKPSSEERPKKSRLCVIL